MAPACLAGLTRCLLHPTTNVRTFGFPILNFVVCKPIASIRIVCRPLGPVRTLKPLCLQSAQQESHTFSLHSTFVISASLRIATSPFFAFFLQRSMLGRSNYDDALRSSSFLSFFTVESDKLPEESNMDCDSLLFPPRRTIAE